MSWTALQPIVRSTGQPMASARVTILASGEAKLWVCLTGMLHDELGGGEAVAVEAGSGEFAGQVRLTFREGAPFKLATFLKGGRRVALPSFEGVPGRAVNTQPCKLVSKGKGELILALPLEAWAAELEERDRRPPPPAPPPPPRAAASPDGGGRLDMAEYLRGKGHKVSALAGERFSVDGETYTREAMLIRVNVVRKRASLPPLTLQQVG